MTPFNVTDRQTDPQTDGFCTEYMNTLAGCLASSGKKNYTYSQKVTVLCAHQICEQPMNCQLWKPVHKLTSHQLSSQITQNTLFITYSFMPCGVASFFQNQQITC